MRKLPSAALLVLLPLLGSGACDRSPPGASSAVERAGGPAPGGSPVCAAAQRVAGLPALLEESSGLAASRQHPGILWTHNDSGGEPTVYAVDASGRLIGTVRVTGARNLDWEDIALGPCAGGDCLYIGDIGDNDAARGEITIYRVPEPAPGQTQTTPAQAFTLTYPDGPRDAEALYVRPDTSIWIVSKGRKSPVALYRLPAGAVPGAAVRLERVQELAPSGSEIDGLVTAADASPDGRWVAVRTYAWLRLYRAAADGHLTAAYPGQGYPLEGADESQGEAVAFGRGDTLWLSSEAAPLGGSPSLGLVRCTLPPAP